MLHLIVYVLKILEATIIKFVLIIDSELLALITRLPSIYINLSLYIYLVRHYIGKWIIYKNYLSLNKKLLIDKKFWLYQISLIEVKFFDIYGDWSSWSWAPSARLHALLQMWCNFYHNWVILWMRKHQLKPIYFAFLIAFQELLHKTYGCLEVASPLLFTKNWSLNSMIWLEIQR